MSARQIAFSVWVGQSFLGSSTLDFDADVRKGLGVYSNAYFCQECGEVWARVAFRTPSGNLYPFFPLALPCARHPPPYRVAVAGSLLLSWDRRYNDAMPEAVWRRELALHLAHYDRYDGRLSYADPLPAAAA